MKLQDIGEFGLIDKIKQGCVVRPKDVIRSIGDDAAVFTIPSNERILLTTDLLIERIHFLRHACSGFDLGFKTMSVNLSDIAAMGGIPKEAFISIAIPANCSVEYIEDIYAGMKKLASEFDVNILGGDTTGSKSDLVISVSLVGSAPEHKILYRNTARPKDLIFSTGFLGDSRAGLHLILNNIPHESDSFQALYKAHILPKPFIREGLFLVQQEGIHAAIDISDGLSSDIRHIMTESQVGALLYHDAIPISKHLEEFCQIFHYSPVEFAISGGEDYVLVITVDPNYAEQIQKSYAAVFDMPLFLIGEITDSNQLEIQYADGTIRPLKSSGWDHFL